MNYTQKTCLALAILTSIAIPSIFPNLPLLAQVFDIPLAKSAYIIAAFALPGLFCIPLAGILADRFGRKAILMPSLYIYAFGGGACIFAENFSTLLLLRFLQGVGGASFSLLYPTLIADNWHGDKRTKVMSYATAAVGISTAAMPALGGALGALSWQLPFLLPLLALPVAYLATKSTLAAPTKQQGLIAYLKQTFAHVRQKHTVQILLLTMCSFALLSGPIITCFPIFTAQKFQAGSLEIGFIIACASLSTGAAALLLQHLCALFSTRGILLLGQCLIAASLLLFPSVPNLWLLVLPIVLFGAGQGVCLPLLATLLSGQTPTEERAGLMAVNSIVIRIAQTGTPLLFGLAITIAGTTAALQFGIFLLFLAGMVLFVGPLPAANLPTK